MPFFSHKRPSPLSHDSVESRSDRRFGRFMRWASLSVLLLVLVAGCVTSYRDAHRSMEYQISRMTRDVSQAFVYVLEPRNGTRRELDNLDKVVTRWRDVLGGYKGLPKDEEMKKSLRDLKALQVGVDGSLGKIARWQAILDHRISVETSPEEQFRAEVLAEQGNWKIVSVPWWHVNGTVLFENFLHGVKFGSTWPYWVGLRFRSNVYHSYGSDWRKLPFDVILQNSLVPWMARLPFSLILGFGVSAVICGYFLCYWGMHLNAKLFSFLGLLYFFYVFIYTLYLVFRMTGIIR